MIGKLLNGRYQIEKPLGKGGFGETFLARDTQMPKEPQCVVKHLHPVSNNPQMLKTATRMFKKEAEVLEEVGEHPQIPRLYAYFTEGEEFYLVQEFIEGKDLTGEMTRPWTPSAVCDLIVEMMEILEFVHSRGVIHRDIKPQNVMRRNKDGRLVLIDFGAVKEISQSAMADSGMMSKSVAVGSKGYTAIEQWSGKPRITSDIYSVGMMAIQALTGKPPWELDEDHRTGEVSWRHLVDFDNKLLDVIDGMVKYMHRERYENARAVLSAFNTHQEVTNIGIGAEGEQRKNEEDKDIRTELSNQPSNKANDEKVERTELILPPPLWQLKYQSEPASAPTVQPSRPAPAPKRESNNKAVEQSKRPPAKPAVNRQYQPPSSSPITREPLITRRWLILTGLGAASAIGAVAITRELTKFPKLVRVEGGKFLMGAGSGVGLDNERPQREVTVKDFSIGVTEVTVAQYSALMDRPSSLSGDFAGDDQPIVYVSWDNAKEYCRRLSARTGQNFRLPSEAEWEYAARGGNKSKGFVYAGSNNLDEVGWYNRNSGDRTRPVGQKKANELGIYDMSGNVWEWCEDVWHDNYNGAPTDGSAWTAGGNQNERVLRGGSWDDSGNICRVANRGYDTLGIRFVNNGFRVVVS